MSVISITAEPLRVQTRTTVINIHEIPNRYPSPSSNPLPGCLERYSALNKWQNPRSIFKLNFQQRRFFHFFFNIANCLRLITTLKSPVTWHMHQRKKEENPFSTHIFHATRNFNPILTYNISCHLLENNVHDLQDFFSVIF